MVRKFNKTGASYSLALMLVLFMTACSEEQSTTTSPSPMPDRTSVSSSGKAPATIDPESHGDEYYEDMSQPLDTATWSEQGKFKKEFTEDCLLRETAGEKDVTSARKSWEKPCKCIADYMSTHLTDEEAEEYLKEDNHTRSLQIRFEAAAYQCLQKERTPQKGKITRY